ncbi:F510_1955 family glycosylhydrolase [Streptomyces sp. KR80]|uniref:F510_1955 family glycosylhydrolase n=1 Tax=Streptomyces sp. KR80 TaxID=3457426 RepID=UPI003FD1BE4D
MTIRPRSAAAAAAVLLAAVLTACTGGSGDTGTADPSEESGPEAAAVSHVHGLGVDPADGRLYIATHEGIITVDKDGSPRRVGDTADYMGFTVAKANTFLGSGHPAEGSADHANRGLIESTDSGKTWKTRSLAGEADFHALDYAHNTIYGYDSTAGMLRVSNDGKTWDNRAELAALDIAVSPANPDLVLATTEDGVAKSTNGGKNFTPGAEPVMAYLSWTKPAGLYGIDPTGALHRSPDNGVTWKKTATVPGGQPQALTAVDADRVLAATQNGVYESRDGGKTFTQRLPITHTAD